MQHLSKISAVTLLFVMFLVTSCGDEEPMDVLTDNFDRSAMLEFWADDIMIPSITHYVEELGGLANSQEHFANNPSIESLNLLRSQWLTAYNAWQEVSLFDIGKAEEVGLRNYTNIYPTNVDLIESNIATQAYNLMLPSNYAAQGFPAMDYLLFGLRSDDAELVQQLSSQQYAQYLSDIIQNLVMLSEEVLDDWTGGYREIFVANNGSSATSSVDKLVNDFLFYYERFFRAGKVGIPAGIFSGSENGLAVEAPYASIYSKMLFTTALDAIERFYDGIGYGANTTNGPSLYDYIFHIVESNNTAPIHDTIKDQWSVVREQLDVVSTSFKNQVETDNIQMLKLYDELQKVVVIMKVDMMQALNIKIDYVDADGD